MNSINESNDHLVFRMMLVSYGDASFALLLLPFVDGANSDENNEKFVFKRLIL